MMNTEGPPVGTGAVLSDNLSSQHHSKLPSCQNKDELDRCNILSMETLGTSEKICQWGGPLLPDSQYMPISESNPMVDIVS